MILKNKKLLVVPFVILFLSLCIAQENTIYEQGTLNEKLHLLFPSANITPIEVLGDFKETYQIILEEPLDHERPEKGTFKHYMYLSHKGYDLPTVIETEGYSAQNKITELSTLLNGNQLIVEYRFYGKSRPETIPWEYLTNDQAIEDYHTIVTKLKKIYSGKWISTGISKGGETTLIYKSKYPKDVEVAVPYVAPIINTTEDPRTDHHIKTVGTKECRDKIITFQRTVLKNRQKVLKEVNQYITAKDMHFTEVPIEEALEYAILEFPFSFWQWGGDCAEIPTSKSNQKEQFDYLNKIVGISFYNDATYYRLLPSYYQHMKELGYYGFDTTPVKDLLQIVHRPTNRRFAPKDVDLTYNPNYMKEVRNFLENKGDHILYIYGEYDTWGACAPSPKRYVKALKMIKEKGSHKTRIKDFSKKDQKKILEKLDEWLNIK
ncbi:prolyl tri/tetrapeptidyl aminopeptidase [Flavobacteriaceae bacterium UJ101]|nr:prolyl tri/tetrapeptidyl aminopeptidase [Flavobacteriaceae bacterium UJ101]